MRNRMLSNTQEKSGLFKEIDSLVSSLSLSLVEVTKTERKGGVDMTVILYRSDSDITLDELESAYNIIYPRYSVLLGERDLNLEVSSPGLGRNIKDLSEFSVFTGKRVRLYSTGYSSYVSGMIESCDERSLTLTDYLIEDKKESGERIVITYDTIAKAKLDYKWEDEK